MLMVDKLWNSDKELNKVLFIFTKSLESVIIIDNFRGDFMSMKLINQLKSDFNFLDISDGVFEQILNKCIYENRSDEENREEVYNIFYKMISDNIIETGEYIDIVKYIDSKFDISSLDNSIESLNKLIAFIGQCKVDINRENYDKLINESPELKKCLEIIINSKEVTKEQKFDLLDEKSSDFLDFYIEDNNSLLEDNFSIEELEDELEEIDDRSLEYVGSSNNATRAYLQSIRAIPLLTNEEEYNLAKEYQLNHNKEVRKKIIESNLRYVASIAYKFNQKFPSVPFLDLVSAGNEGLMRALEDYDPDKSRFTTYATAWIIQKMRREMQDNYTNIRVPVHRQEKMNIYFKKKDELEKQLGREATLIDIKEKLGYSLDTINEYENNISKTISLNTKISEERDASELLDLIPDSEDCIPEDVVVKNDKKSVEILLDNLSEVEKMIIKLRTGLYDEREYTLEESAMMLYKLGLKDKVLTRERVRQLEKKAIRKIRRTKEKYERNIELLGNGNEATNFINQTATINDVVTLIRITEKKIMCDAISNLCNSYRVVLYECFGKDILAARLQNPTRSMIKYLITVVYPKLLYEVNRNTKLRIINPMPLPLNIYEVDDRYLNDDVEKQIDELEPYERIIINKFYDIYTGKLRVLDNITSYEKEQIVIIINKIKIGLINFRIPAKLNKEKITKNKIFHYFGEENKELVILIIETLQNDEIEFLQNWYGENYDLDPRMNGDLYNKMDKYRRDKIFNKIKKRLERFKSLQAKGTDITIEEFVKSKEVNRCSKDNIYTYFEYEEYTEEELAQAISELPDRDRNLLQDYYGSDLKHPIINHYMSEELKRRVLNNIFKKIRKRLVNNKNNKVLKKEYTND